MTSYYTDNMQESIAFLTWVTQTVKAASPQAYLVAEAMASEEALYASYNPDYVNAPFYTNHDMARSTGYYAYDDGSRTKLAGALNLLMTGNAFIYYGEELGMKGSGKDENKRAPMYWSSDPQAEGMCQGPPDMDAVSMKFDAFDAQSQDSDSVWRYFANAARIRSAFPAIASGKTQPLEAMSGEHLCAFIREGAGDAQSVLVLINTGEQAETVTLSGDAQSYTTVAAVLTVGAADGTKQAVTVKGSNVTLPPFGIAVLSE